MKPDSPKDSRSAQRAFVDGLVTADYTDCLPLLKEARLKGSFDLNKVIEEATPKLMAEAVNALGSYLRGTSQREEAELLYETALSAGVDVRLNFANLLSESPDNHTRARALYQDAWASGDLEALNNLAQLLTKAGDTAAAESIYLEAIGHGDPLAWRNYALFLLEENRLHEAEAQLTKLAQAHPDAGERPLADLLALLGRWAIAFDLYRQVDARGGDLPRAVRQAVRRGDRKMPPDKLRRSLSHSRSRVREALDYGRGRRPKVFSGRVVPG
jgi:tetratricopeptide (TPR) repeat protein